MTLWRRAESSPLKNNRRTALSRGELHKIWEKVRTDADGKRALLTLQKHGFKLAKLEAGGESVTWADFVAAIPLLSTQQASRRVRRGGKSKFSRALIAEMRGLVVALGDPFTEVRISTNEDGPVPRRPELCNELLAAVKTLEKSLEWDWYVRRRNPRNAAIAQLRWEIRSVTRKPHDAELGILIDAAYRAAGFPDGCYIDATALDRIEKREKEGRVKATRKLRSGGAKRIHFLL